MAMREGRIVRSSSRVVVVLAFQVELVAVVSDENSLLESNGDVAGSENPQAAV